jgi:hypothetical protein
MNPILDVLMRVGGSVLDRVIPDPEQRAQAKLELAEQAANHELEIERIATERIGLYLSDRQSARDREKHIRDMTPRVLAYCTFGGFFCVLAMLAFVDIPGANSQALIYLLGSLQTILAGVVAYYFGSSEGSSRKQDTLDRLLPGGAAPTQGVEPGGDQ